VKILIYHCSRVFCGCLLNAVVQANSEDRAIEMLEWTSDEDVEDINVQEIGIATSSEEKEWCKESL